MMAGKSERIGGVFQEGITCVQCLSTRWLHCTILAPAVAYELVSVGKVTHSNPLILTLESHQRPISLS